MKFLLTLSHAHPGRWPDVVLPGAAMLLISFAAGCASPAPPRPPSLKLPEIVKDLSAERVDGEVRLRWTTPEKTTDHLLIDDSITAEICRISISADSPVTPHSQTPSKPPACAPVKKIPVRSGPTQTTDVLLASLTVDPVSLLAYRVQLFNSKGHSAGLSAEAFAAAGAAPPPVEHLHASSIRDGAMLEWLSSHSTASIELDRRLVGPDGKVVESAPSKAASKSQAKPSKKDKKAKAKATPKAAPATQSKPLDLAPPTPVEIKLQTPKDASDAGGTIDRATQKSVTYRYTAQRVRTVSLGGHTLELRSVTSAPLTLAMRDIFPPHAPSGLEAVPGGIRVSDLSIDLSWTPNTDTDLAGYIVYRQEVNSAGVAAGIAARLNPIPVVGPAYRDQTAVTGHRYAYRVTAVDTAGNESPPSAEVQETLREQ